MKMNHRRTPAITVAALLCAVVVDASPAAADDDVVSGLMQVKGNGSLYSGGAAIVSLNANPGATATFSAKIVNTGTVGTQYAVVMRHEESTPVKTVITIGSLNITPYVSRDYGYFTAPIDPGKSQTMTIKVTPPAGSPQGYSYLDLAVYPAFEAGSGGEGIFVTNIKPTAGHTGYDLYARYGTAAFIGGAFTGQFASSPPFKASATAKATYTVRLANDGATPTTIGLLMDSMTNCTGAFTTNVKDGSVDVTAAAFAGSYVTPVLAGGTHRDLTVTITHPANDPACFDEEIRLDALAGQGGLTAYSSYINAVAG